ncbi:TetR family transcriptional regulator [Acetobacter pasteurianus NBRC 3299]|nr:TetR family transcriptional regulator [Acetobacter pasteurianus]GCD75165.1 TetR family transcriptional regulator [Acetobacter pasteurianus NBRC 3299]
MTEYPQKPVTKAKPTTTRPKKSYRASQKREMTRAFKQDAFESAAWKVFSGIGLDAATVRDIVALSNVSPGSFYNYYKTKEAIFDIILVKVAQRVRNAARLARSEEDNLDAMLQKSQCAAFRELLSIHGAPHFLELNQHHIRAKLFNMSETREMLDDLKQNLLKRVPMKNTSPERMDFIAAAVLTTALEGLLYIARNPLVDIDQTSRLTAGMAAAGIHAAAAAAG